MIPSGIQLADVTDPTLESIEADLDRAADLAAPDAVELLQSARADLRELEADPDADDDRREELEHRLEQRIREVKRRDEYGSGLGAAMNPEEDDAP